MWHAIQAIKNVLTLVRRGLTHQGRAAWRFGKNECQDFKNGMILIVAIHATIMALGVAIGWFFHDVVHVSFLITVGRFLIAYAALFFAAGLFYLWARTTFITEVLVIAAAAIKKLPVFTINLPDLEVGREGEGKTQWRLDMRDWIKVHHADLGLEQAQATKFIKMLMGVMAWLALVGVYATTVPVYHDPVAFMGVLVAGFFLAYATVGWNRKTKFGETAVFYGVIAIAVIATINFFGSVVCPNTITALAGKAYAFAKSIPGIVVSEMYGDGISADKRVLGVRYVYGALALFCLMIFIFSLVYFARTSRVRKVVPALVGILALAGLGISGWYLLMSKSYAGLPDKDDTARVAEVAKVEAEQETAVPAQTTGPVKTPPTEKVQKTQGPSKKRLMEINNQLLSMKQKLMERKKELQGMDL